MKDIDRFQEKITVSLHQASLLPNLEHIKLGVVVKEELPVHYRLVRVQKDTQSQSRTLTLVCGKGNLFEN